MTFPLSGSHLHFRMGTVTLRNSLTCPSQQGLQTQAQRSQEQVSENRLVTFHGFFFSGLDTKVQIDLGGGGGGLPPQQSKERVLSHIQRTLNSSMDVANLGD